jgi:hypothetical protein
MVQRQKLMTRADALNAVNRDRSPRATDCAKNVSFEDEKVFLAYAVALFAS